MTPIGADAGKGGATTPWYLAGGVSAPQAAYQAKGAASLAASYVNLVTPGTYDAYAGIAPTLGANGWAFDGNAYLNTGIIPNTGYSALVQFINHTNNGWIIGSRNAAGTLVFGVASYVTSPLSLFANGTSINIPTASGAGNYAVTDYGYIDGSVVTASLSNGGAPTQIMIGALNNNGSPAAKFIGSIVAVVIYSVNLDASQIAAIAAAMAAL